MYHCEIQKQNVNWYQFTIENGFETIKEEEGEEHILVVIDDEGEIQHPMETSPKLPMGGRKTRSMVLKEKELEEKDKIFTTYERRTRKRPQVQKGQIQEKEDESTSYSSGECENFIPGSRSGRRSVTRDRYIFVHEDMKDFLLGEMLSPFLCFHFAL